MRNKERSGAALTPDVRREKGHIAFRSAMLLIERDNVQNMVNHIQKISAAMKAALSLINYPNLHNAVNGLYLLDDIFRRRVAQIEH